MDVLRKNINNFVVLTIFFVCVQTQLRDHFESVNTACHGQCECKNTSDTFLINCTNRGLEQILNSWPPHKDHLIASFSGNNISDLKQIPASDAKTISISFSNCGIKTLASAMFIDAIKIQFLDLSWNSLTGQEIRGDVFRGRYSNFVLEPIYLTDLDLSHNFIESVHHNTFEHIPYLKKLNLNHNPLRIIDPQTSKAISSLLHLQVLHLANTSLKSIPKDAFARLNKLTDVDLSDNKLETVPETLTYLSGSLEKLKIGGNPIKVLEDHDFMGLHKLKQLNISGMSELTSIYHNTFAYLPDLKVLYCENNRNLWHIHEHAFGIEQHIPLLQELYLSDNNLRTLPPTLIHWSNLSVITLDGNRWHCDCEIFNTISIISNFSNIISPVASCSTPLDAAGTALDNLLYLEKLCKQSLDIQRGEFRTVHSVLMKTVLILAVVFLTLVACFVFWKIVVRFNTIRSINTMFPVMYISAPTTEN